jgi:methyl-accepting chemotaxis protein
LKEFVSVQTDLVGGKLKTAVDASTKTAYELVKTVEGNKALVDSLSAGSQALNESITPIREMIVGASDLAHSSVSAAETLKTMVEDVPNSFTEPLGLMMSAVELLTEGTAAVMNQMNGLESLSASIGNGEEANEIKILLEKLVSSSEEIAKGRVDISETVFNFSQDLRPLIESIESLKRAIDRWEK